jgi:hypothetical protein
MVEDIIAISALIAPPLSTEPTAAPNGGSVRAAVQHIGNALQQPATALSDLAGLEQRADIGRLNKHSLGLTSPSASTASGPGWIVLSAA